jgi:ArsR family transcriptional regulator, arsenate/arsenite/antimonite-responsive transcriptional repressor
MHLTDQHLLDALKAAADPTRLKILRLLKEKGHCSIGKGAGLCARDIEKQFQLSQPTISHHMAVLTRAGLVRTEKHGLWMWYRRDEKALKALGRSLSGAA